MVGAAYSFVKMVVAMLCIHIFLQDHDTVIATIGRLTGSKLRVSMRRIVSTPQFSIVISLSESPWVGL